MMDTRYHITITDKENGKPISLGGVPGSVNTNLGFVTALAASSSDETGRHSMYFTAVIGQDVSGMELFELALQVFRTLHKAATSTAEKGLEQSVMTSVILTAFTEFLRETFGPEQAGIILAGMIAVNAGKGK